MFEFGLSLQERTKIIIVLSQNGTNNPPHRIQVLKETNSEKQLSDFIIKNNTMLFSLNNNFLKIIKKDPCMWKGDTLFINSQKIAEKWMVVNDLADLGIH